MESKTLPMSSSRATSQIARQIQQQQQQRSLARGESREETSWGGEELVTVTSKVTKVTKQIRPSLYYVVLKPIRHLGQADDEIEVAPGK